MQRFIKLINKYTDTLIPIGLAGLFLYLLNPLYGVDFWYDEVMSLEEYILVPFKKTVTDYSAPNNHIFFSLLMNVWCKLWGITTFAQAVENVFIIRLSSAILTSLTIITVFATTKKISNGYAGLVAAISLMCILPYYNYGVQVRGYVLSMALAAMLAYCLTRFYNSRQTLWGILVSTTTALLLYTIPSNLYPVLALLMVLGVYVASTLFKSNFKSAIKSTPALAGMWIFGGVVIAIGLYLPVLNQVVNNDYVKTEGLFRMEIWGEAVGIFQSFFRPYYILPILLLTGIVVGLIKKAKLQPVWILIAVIILPFVISYVRGDRPFDRTFLWIVPLMAVWAGISYAIIYENWIKNAVLKNGFGMLLLILIGFGFNDGRKEIKTKLAHDVKNEKREYSIYYNNLLSPYHTYKNLKNFKQNQYNDSIPVYLEETDKYAMHGYLPALGINWEHDHKKIKSVNRYYIITAYPTVAIKKYVLIDSTFTFTRLNPEMDFVNILEARRRE